MGGERERRARWGEREDGYSGDRERREEWWRQSEVMRKSNDGEEGGRSGGIAGSDSSDWA
jgi:hypothetical protein